MWFIRVEIQKLSFEVLFVSESAISRRRIHTEWDSRLPSFRCCWRVSLRLYPGAARPTWGETTVYTLCTPLALALLCVECVQTSCLFSCLNTSTNSLFSGWAVEWRRDELMIQRPFTSFVFQDPPFSFAKITPTHTRWPFKFYNPWNKDTHYCQGCSWGEWFDQRFSKYTYLGIDFQAWDVHIEVVDSGRKKANQLHVNLNGRRLLFFGHCISP